MQNMTVQPSMQQQQEILRLENKNLQEEVTHLLVGIQQQMAE
jgi:hypothetical protein